jgi:PTS system cellobiose-specific IIB component
MSTIKILLVCSAGMSTSLLVEKMKKAAREKKIEAEIWAIGSSSLDAELNTKDVDVVLVGPQMRYELPRIQERASHNNIKAEGIDMQDYGLCRAEKVLDQALQLISSS